MNRNKFTNLIIFILIIWCLSLSIVQYSNNNKTKKDKNENEIIVDGFSTDFTKVVDENKTSIVSINSAGILSTGFVYKQVDNVVYIVTSYHGIEHGYINVSFGDVYNVHANIVGKDLYADLAVISIETPYSINPLNIADATLLKDGEFVINIGTANSTDFTSSVQLGMISKNIRTIENSITVDNKKINYYLNVIQLSSNLYNGYSGSPVLNMNGEVIGMITMKYNDDINLAITSNEIKLISDRIINQQDKDSRYNYGVKGTYISKMDNYVKSNLNINIDTVSGLYVEKIMDYSFAQFAGIKTGDIILSINGVELNDFDDYLNSSYMNISILTFKVLRNNEEILLPVNLND